MDQPDTTRTSKLDHMIRLLNEINQNLDENETPGISKLDNITHQLDNINQNLLYLVTLIELEHSYPKIQEHGKMFAKWVKMPGFNKRRAPSPEPSGGQDAKTTL